MTFVIYCTACKKSCELWTNLNQPRTLSNEFGVFFRIRIQNTDYFLNFEYIQWELKKL